MIKRITQDELIISLPGRLTYENAETVKKELLEDVKAYPGREVKIDADNLTYISSSGLRALLTLIKTVPNTVTIYNTSPEIYDIFSETGFDTIMNIEKKLRNISVENCAVLGKGRSSTVYRLNPDTIVKRYEPTVPLEMIHHEMGCAKKAFLAGIPTAISFDLVRVGDTYGVVFELIAAKTVGHAISENIDLFDEITEKFVNVYKKIHMTRLSEFPPVKETWNHWVDGMSQCYAEEDIAFMREMIDNVPERDTMVHCDFHENNVLYQNGELIIIDMADLSHGHPIFDLAGGAFRTHCSLMPERKASHGLSPENMQRFWDTILRFYFQTADEKELQDIKEMCDAFGFLRSALFPMKHVEITQELKELHIEDANKNLFARKDWAREQMRKLEKYFPDSK